ncbi:uncharacterized protein LOC123529124 [Mercenaria mercenaria]|uniref:uncharacterized protein LOC123529124 n=1 Tax=Mercenaria mercenaria TaxID=6596 RepID=UPI00234F89E0|nr:uncharacterized protein LOC123529124 [Mercenaria mercenaria]
MSKSRPLVLGFIAEQTLTTELSMCRLVKKDNEPYWINKKDQVLQNSTNTRCRTIQFSGTNLHLDEDVPCWLLSHSICEADRSFCQTSGNNSTVRNGWIKVAKQKPSYKLSSAKYTYCDAKFLCEETWHSKIASAGNESFMELLGISLGITQQMMIGFWTESPGMSCSHGQGEGYVTQYTGPTVHTIEIRKSVNVFKVLCEKDDSTTKATSAMLSSILQTRLQPNTQSGFSPTTYHLTTASNLQTNTQLRQSQLSTEPLKIQKTQSTIVSSTASPTPARSSMQNLATSLLASTDAVWDRIEQEEYFVDYNPMNYNQAETFCREVMNASLVMFLNPLRYFTVLAQIALTNNSFWVGAW